MIPLYFLAEAKKEASAAATYYETQQAGLGSQILQFPNGIIYRCRRNKIEILAVMHLHRKPGYWKSRI